MRFSHILIAIWASLLYTSFAIAQADLSTDVEEAIVEQLLEGLDQSVDISEFTETLRNYRRYPIDLNKSDGKDFAHLMFLSPVQIASILAHRLKAGNFLSVLELQAVEGLDLTTVEKLIPFVIVQPSGLLEGGGLQEAFSKIDQNVIVRYARILQRQTGYAITDTKRSRYLGDANRYTVRYRLRIGDYIRLAINMEKDAGEPFFKEQQRWGFDHYGVSLHLKRNGFLREVMLGDYAMQVGQGLVLWNGLSFGKGPMITTTARIGMDLRSYTSMNEYNFLRGIAGKLQWHGLSFVPFLSWRKLSGNRVQTERGMEIHSLSLSGLHRTPNELRNRRQIDHLTTGVNVSYERARLRFGALALYSQYNGTIVPSSAVGAINRFTGKSSLHAAANYQLSFRNFYLFGEYAYHLHGTWATTNGVIASLAPKLSIFANYRNYKPAYYAPFSQALGEGSIVANERAVYAGVTYQLARKLTWVAYADLVRFP